MINDNLLHQQTRLNCKSVDMCAIHNYSELILHVHAYIGHHFKLKLSIIGMFTEMQFVVYKNVMQYITRVVKAASHQGNEILTTNGWEHWSATGNTAVHRGGDLYLDAFNAVRVTT